MSNKQSQQYRRSSVDWCRIFSPKIIIKKRIIIKLNTVTLIRSVLFTFLWSYECTHTSPRVINCPDTKKTVKTTNICTYVSSLKEMESCIYLLVHWYHLLYELLIVYCISTYVYIFFYSFIEVFVFFDFKRMMLYNIGQCPRCRLKDWRKNLQISGQVHELACVQNWCGADKPPTMPVFAKNWLNQYGDL